MDKFKLLDLGAVVSFLALVITLNTNSIATTCADKARTNTEIFNLVTESKIIAQFELQMPKMCFPEAGNGRALSEPKINTSIDERGINQILEAHSRMLRTTSKLSATSNIYYENLLESTVHIWQDSKFILGTLQINNFSGGILKMPYLQSEFARSLVTFQKQCADDGNLANAYKAIDKTYANFVDEANQIQKRCKVGEYQIRLLELVVHLFIVLGSLMVFFSIYVFSKPTLSSIFNNSKENVKRKKRKS